MVAQHAKRVETDGESEDRPNDLDQVKALTFGLGSRKYCVDIGYIAEIVNCGEITTLPGSPAHIEGIVALRDEAVRVINLKRLLGNDGEYDDEKLIVFKRGTDADSRLGWIIDEIHGVDTFSNDDIETASDEPGIAGVIQADGAFILWLEPAEIRI